MFQITRTLERSLPLEDLDEGLKLGHIKCNGSHESFYFDNARFREELKNSRKWHLRAKIVQVYGVHRLQVMVSSHLDLVDQHMIQAQPNYFYNNYNNFRVYLEDKIRFVFIQNFFVVQKDLKSCDSGFWFDQFGAPMFWLKINCESFSRNVWNNTNYQE